MSNRLETVHVGDGHRTSVDVDLVRSELKEALNQWREDHSHLEKRHLIVVHSHFDSNEGSRSNEETRARSVDHVGRIGHEL